LTEPLESTTWNPDHFTVTELIPTRTKLQIFKTMTNSKQFPFEISLLRAKSIDKVKHNGSCCPNNLFLLRNHLTDFD